MDDRLTILLAQLDAAWEMFDARLHGLTDDEYFWEPAPHCWSLRRRGEAQSPLPYGAGDWVLDGQRPPLNPPPFTTIAWRMCHLAVSPLGRYDWTFGGHTLDIDDIVWPASADEAIAFVRQAHTQWRDALAGVSSADLDTVGLSTMPFGLDPQVRFVDLVAWTNTEFTHHAAEVACLRDLYGATRSA
jgi:hypothetical protein